MARLDLAFASFGHALNVSVHVIETTTKLSHEFSDNEGLFCRM